VPVPTYSMYGVLSGQRGAEVVALPRLAPGQGFGLDLDAVEAALPGASIVWLCAPNNPTGAPEPLAVIERVLAMSARLPTPPLVVVDEAYAEFSTESAVPLRAHWPDLVVVRTVSKAFGLAGIRVGYAVAARPTIERLERLRPPGSISTISAALAARALERGELAWANARALAAERDWLAGRLGGVGLPAYPSITNFLLVRVGDAAAAEDLTTTLLRVGMVIRTFGPSTPLPGHVRLTARSRPENERLLEVLSAWRERTR
jgi:histidinol-phosphate/aromatic aminotransferase/cobyric acid decarboxylase-like protein